MGRITKENFITDDKTNRVFISSYIDKKSGDLDLITGKELLKKLKELFPSLEILYNTRDVWCRDYMPIQLTEDTFLNYRYHPDYLTTDYPDCITDWKKHKVKTKSQLIEETLPKIIDIPLILDGGNVIKAVINDKPSIILCDKVLEENQISKDDFLKWWDEWWKENFDGTEMKCILIPWEGKNDNPIGHADGILRYLGAGKLLMTNYADLDKAYALSKDTAYDPESSENIYKKISDSLKKQIDKDKENLIVLSYDKILDNKYKIDAQFRMIFDNSWSYINFLQVGKKIFVPELGCPELDKEALKQIADAFKSVGEEFEVKPIGINMLPIIAGYGHNNSGGALNCLSWTIKD